MARRAKGGTAVAGAVQLRVAGAITGILLLAYIVTIWAMTTKPT
jgi:hypothetical protein